MKTTTSTAIALLLGLGLALPAAAQQQATALQQQGADMDADSYVSMEEATAFDEQRFGEIAEGGDEITQEQFTEAMSEAQDAEGMFAEADADQSGTLDQDEWMQYRQQRFTEGTQDTEGQMEVGQYETFERGGDMM